MIFKHTKKTQFNLKNGCKNETETLGILHGASGETHQVSNEQTQERSGGYGETAAPTTPLQSDTSAATSTAAIRALDDGREATGGRRRSGRGRGQYEHEPQCLVVRL